MLAVWGKFSTREPPREQDQLRPPVPVAREDLRRRLCADDRMPLRHEVDDVRIDGPYLPMPPVPQEPPVPARRHPPMLALTSARRQDTCRTPATARPPPPRSAATATRSIASSRPLSSKGSTQACPRCQNTRPRPPNPSRNARLGKIVVMVRSRMPCGRRVHAGPETTMTHGGERSSPPRRSRTRKEAF